MIGGLAGIIHENMEEVKDYVIPPYREICE